MGNDEVDLKIDEARALDSSWDEVASDPGARPRDTRETEFNFSLPGGVNRVIDDVAAELVPGATPRAPSKPPSRSQPTPTAPVPSKLQSIARAPPPSPPPPLAASKIPSAVRVPGSTPPPALRPAPPAFLANPKLPSVAQAPPPSAPPPVHPMLTPAWGMTPPPVEARPLPPSPPPPPPIDEGEVTPLAEESPRVTQPAELPPPRRAHPPPPAVPSAHKLVADLRSVSMGPRTPAPAPGLKAPGASIRPDRPTMLIDGEAVALEHMVAKSMGQTPEIEVPSMVITGTPVSLLEPGLVIAPPPAPNIIVGTPTSGAPTPAELRRVDLSEGLLDLVPSVPARPATNIPASTFPVPSPRPAPVPPLVAQPLADPKAAAWWKPFGLGVAVASALWLIWRLFG